MGPVEGSLLVQGLRDGTYKADDEACVFGGSSWVPILTVPEVADAMVPSGSAPPGQPQPTLGTSTQSPTPASMEPTERVPMSHIIVLAILAAGGILLGLTLKTFGWPLLVLSAICVYADAWALLGLPQPVPNCDTAEVTKTLDRVLADAVNNLGRRDLNVVRLGTPREVRFEQEPERRTCRTEVFSEEEGRSELLYTVEWQDSAKRTFLVQVVSP